MVDLSTKYMGLSLRNPIIVGSSGLTNSVKDIQHAAKAGAGAVVLKSIFEEQIRLETDKFISHQDQKMEPFRQGYSDLMSKRDFDYAEAEAYIADFAREHTLGEYLKLIEEVKKAVDIPVIASINCVSPYDWHYFARRIQAAGADALELNIYILPSDPGMTSEGNEQTYFTIAEAVMKQVTIPVSIKVGYYFSSLSSTLIRLSNTGIKGLVMFNRPFHPDIDINSLEISSKYLLSEAPEYSHTLRWMALLSGKTGCDLVASTGIHDHEAVIKQLLAGATAVQMASVFYKHGFNYLSEVLSGMKNWMVSKGFNTPDDFRGKLSQKNVDHPAAFERVQFMKLYSKIE
jgi:dihydroorotate dehydrogenase (fumarate)